MIKKLSQYLAKKGISDAQLLQLIAAGGLALFVGAALIYGAVGALLQ